MGIIQALPGSGAWAAAQGRFVNRTRRTPATRGEKNFIVLLYTIIRKQASQGYEEF
jgi:hypothetical protein